MKTFALLSKNYLKFIVFIIAAGLAASVQAQLIYNTEFTSGGALATTYVSGSFSATFTGVSLSYYSGYNILNIGAGTLSLAFSQPVTSILFDVGGLDTSWGDKIIFSQVPAIGPAQTSAGYYNLNTLNLNGTTITPRGNSSGGRMTFSGLPNVTSFVWTDAGTAGNNDWILYDNFSFTTSPVPEPSTLAILAVGSVLVLRCRRLRRLYR
jgi:hypothetical protein